MMSTMLREPRTALHFHAPPEFLCAPDDGAAVVLPMGLRVHKAALHGFARLMAADGRPLQLARLGYDRLYAIECCAHAHASADATVRAAALELFAAFEARRT